VPRSEFFKVNTNDMYDEFGDEFDCRLKSIHSQGNVGKAEWKNLGGHSYTGIFLGADTGFVRLSSAFPVLRPEDIWDDDEDKLVMNPTMAMKFLRDQTWSANAVANHEIWGQTSYNFFEGNLHSNLADTTENVMEHF